MPEILVATDADWILDEVRAALGGEATTIRWVRNGKEVRPALQAACCGPRGARPPDREHGRHGDVHGHPPRVRGGRLPDVGVLMLLDRSADVFLAQRSNADGWLIKPLDAFRLRCAADANPSRRDLPRGRARSGLGSEGGSQRVESLGNDAPVDPAPALLAGDEPGLARAPWCGGSPSAAPCRAVRAGRTSTPRPRRRPCSAAVGERGRRARRTPGRARSASRSSRARSSTDGQQSSRPRSSLCLGLETPIDNRRCIRESQCIDRRQCIRRSRCPESSSRSTSPTSTRRSRFYTKLFAHRPAKVRPGIRELRDRRAAAQARAHRGRRRAGHAEPPRRRGRDHR